MKWLRFRERAGTFHWDYSADGQDWTNLASVPVWHSVASSVVELGAADWGSGTPSGYAYWDNLYVGRVVREHVPATRGTPPLDRAPWTITNVFALAAAVGFSVAGAVWWLTRRL